ncbi:hypothetical protein Tco_0892650 [Tanacetum coccineum]|uniref:Uncharacterized protein n=1 Tax=Tanacetum coccineum TaxID=301880 RepID=A0ABQ5C9J5_9ASTR
MIFNIDSAMKQFYSNDDTCFSIDVIDEILEEDSDALLDEGSKILYSIKGTLLEEEIFAEFDEFIHEKKDELVAVVVKVVHECLVVPKFLPTDDPIESLNKAMAFLSTVITSRYPQTKNKLRTLSNPRNQAAIQDGQGKAIGTWVSKNTGNDTANQSRIIRCYKCRGKDDACSSSRSGVALDEEQLAFLADIGERVDSGPNSQALITTAIFQTYDIDAFDSDCDEMPTSSAVFMANLSAYDSDVLSKVKLDLQPLSPKLRKIRDAPVDYVKETKEHAGTLREIVEPAIALKPLDNALDYACKFTTRIQELLVYVSATCPSSRKESEKLVVVAPMNKNRQVSFAEPSTSTSNKKTGRST